MHLQHMSIQLMSVFRLDTVFSQTSRLLFMFQCNKHVEMNRFFVYFGKHLDDNNR